jgi:hypothetical protein
MLRISSVSASIGVTGVTAIADMLGEGGVIRPIAGIPEDVG